MVSVKELNFSCSIIIKETIPGMLQTFNPKVYMSPEKQYKNHAQVIIKIKMDKDLAAEFITFSGVPEDFKMSNWPIVD